MRAFLAVFTCEEVGIHQAMGGVASHETWAGYVRLKLKATGLVVVMD